MHQGKTRSYMKKDKTRDRKKDYPIYSRGDLFEGKAPGEVFHHIFEERHWDLEEGAESISGPGSSREQTRHLIAVLPEFLRSHNIRSMLDIPCGDFNWMRFVNLTGIDYTGADVVEAIVSHNRQHYTTEHHRFEKLDLLVDLLPPTDLLFCRDCLVHFSCADIRRAIKNIQRSDIRFLLTTTFTEEESNEDIATGGWRPVNFEKPPFSWGMPLDLIVEGCTEQNGAFADKSMGLWELVDLSAPE